MACVYYDLHESWWRHQMETISALLALCAGNSPVTGGFPAQRPVTRSFHVFCDLHLNKRLSKQSWGWWFETLSRPLWRHRNDIVKEVTEHTAGRFASLMAHNVAIHHMYHICSSVYILNFKWWHDREVFNSLCPSDAILGLCCQNLRHG